MAVAAWVFYAVSFRTGEPPDISGVYLFKTKNCSQDGCFFGAHPDFSISYLPDGEEVQVSKTADGFLITHIGWTGRKNTKMKMELNQNNPDVGWNRKEIVYKWSRLSTGLGLSRQSRGIHFFLDDTGSLIIQSTYRETGLGFFVIPFTESYRHKMKLVRIGAS
jgi:hypothetical protein